MELNYNTFKTLKIGDILVKDPCYEDKTEYTITNITKKFICYQFNNRMKGIVKGRINTKYYTDENTHWITKWNIKDEQWQNEWDKYFEGCGTEQWYYAHGFDN